MGTRPSPWARSHARANWAGVTCFVAAISFTRSTSSMFFWKVLSLKPRPVATPVVLWQILEASQLAGEEAAAERAVRDEITLAVVILWSAPAEAMQVLYHCSDRSPLDVCMPVLAELSIDRNRSAAEKCRPADRFAPTLQPHNLEGESRCVRQSVWSRIDSLHQIKKRSVSKASRNSSPPDFFGQTAPKLPFVKKMPKAVKNEVSNNAGTITSGVPARAAPKPAGATWHHQGLWHQSSTASDTNAFGNKNHPGPQKGPGHGEPKRRPLPSRPALVGTRVGKGD